MQTKVYPQM